MMLLGSLPVLIIEREVNLKGANLFTSKKLPVLIYLHFNAIHVANRYSPLTWPNASAEDIKQYRPVNLK